MLTKQNFALNISANYSEVTARFVESTTEEKPEDAQNTLGLLKYSFTINVLSIVSYCTRSQAD